MKRGSTALADQILFPTPLASDGMRSKMKLDTHKKVAIKRNRAGNINELVSIQNARKTGGRLNSNFVEFLMGYQRISINSECQENWWKTEFKLRGIPNGISTELDKDRVNRIKALGNAIVPQIPYYIGLAIKKVMENSDSDGWTNK
tara:strand:- start:749 stop:1186 length:438 start_codon:yes stop_codon:yes gene_type:complete